jgi:hypothetical protein
MISWEIEGGTLKREERSVGEAGFGIMNDASEGRIDGTPLGGRPRAPVGRGVRPGPEGE